MTLCCAAAPVGGAGAKAGAAQQHQGRGDPALLAAHAAGGGAATARVVEVTGQTLQRAVAALSGTWDLNGAGGAARFFSPYGVAVSPDGAVVYVGEAYKNRIRAVRVADGTVTTLAGSGNRGYADGPGATARFSWPYGVAVAPDGGTVFVADSGNDCVRSVDVVSGVVSTLAGGGTRGFADGEAATSRFSWPYGVATSPDGTVVYVADSGNNRVRAIDVRLGAVTTLAGAGSAGFQDGPSATARFYGPRGVVVSPDGAVVYVADYSNFRVRAVDRKAGRVSTIMGGGGADEVITTSGVTYKPAGVAVSPDGSAVLVADSANNRIRTVTVGHRRAALPPGASNVGHTGKPNASWEARAPAPAVGQNSYWAARDGNTLSADPYADAGELDADMAAHQRVLILVIVLVILGLLAVGAVMAGALWQRRNALLTLRLWQGYQAVPAAGGGPYGGGYGEPTPGGGYAMGTPQHGGYAHSWHGTPAHDGWSSAGPGSGYGMGVGSGSDWRQYGYYTHSGYGYGPDPYGGDIYDESDYGMPYVHDPPYSPPAYSPPPSRRPATRPSSSSSSTHTTRAPSPPTAPRMVGMRRNNTLAPTAAVGMDSHSNGSNSVVRRSTSTANIPADRSSWSDQV